MDFKIVAIDGPTGVGKSTITKLLAQKKNYLYVDTGAMFRCLAWRWQQLGTPDNEEIIKQLGDSVVIEFKPDGRIFCDEHDVTELIRQEEISALASAISKYPVIRHAMKSQQRQLVDYVCEKGSYSGAVLEGRDIGTVVFPNADYKFFVDADPAIRAKRRYDQLTEKGQQVDYEEIFAALKQRDHQDRNREVAPLKAADDAIIVDTGNLSIEDVLVELIKVIDDTP